MSAQFLDGSNVPTQNRLKGKGGILKSILTGRIPLALLLVMVVTTLLLTALARQLSAASGFFEQQQVSLIVLIAGLALATVVYIVALVRTQRRVARWQPGSAQVRATLLTLGATVLFVVLPVLLAIVLPQSPAP